MSVFKKCQILLLPTNEKSKLVLSFKEKSFNQLIEPRITLIEESNYQLSNIQSQHLYILSSEEIKEGDIWFDGTNIRKDYPMSFIKDIDKKIIAATDSSLRIGKLEVGGKIEHLPQIPQSFIEYFIFEYNRGNIITEVMAEYELNNEDFDDIIEKVWNDDYKLKINKDNTINIKSIISTYEEIGEKIVQYCKKYEGTDKYTDVLKAIEFGYKLSLNQDEK